MFYLRKEGGMMYWGGEYVRDVEVASARRAVQFNSRGLSNGVDRSSRFRNTGPNPTFEFKVVAGPPLKSRYNFFCMLLVD